MTQPTSTEPRKTKKRLRGVVTINREHCKGCGICIELCPTHALELETNYNTRGYRPPFLAKHELCTGCDNCGLYCPDFAIFGQRQPHDEASVEREAEPGTSHEG